MAAVRSLADDLRLRDDAALVGLLRRRPDLATPLPADITQLATRSSTRISVTRALDRLDRFALQVLDAVVVLPEPVAPAAVTALFDPAHESSVLAVLADAHAQALLWHDGTGLHPTRTLLDVLAPHPAGLGPPARQALAALAPARLASLAQALGGRPSGDPVSDATAVADVLADGARLAELLDEVGEATRAVLAVLAAGPPVGRVSAATTGGATGSPFAPALARGLLVPTDPDSVVLPREVGLHLRGGRLHPGATPTPPPPDDARRDPALVDRAAGGNAQTLVGHVEALLEAWASTPPTVLRGGGLGVRDLKRVAALLDVDDGHAAFVAELAWIAGLVGTDAPQGRWLPTPSYDTWSRRSWAHRWAALAAAWLPTSRVPALVGVRTDRERLLVALGPDLDRAAAAEVRTEVLRALAALPPGGTATPGELVEHVAWRRPRRAGPLRDDLVAWTADEAEALGVTGLGALSTAGRELVGGADLDVVAGAMGGQLPAPVDHVLVQADLTAIAPGPLQPELGREMGLLADVESTGGATVYRFTAASIRRGLDAGRSAADVHAFLARIARTSVPQPLTYLVDDMARRHGALRVGTAASFLRADDPAALEALLVDRRTAPLRLRRLAPTVLASGNPPGLLLERLRALGLAPVAEAEDGSVVVAKPAGAERAPARPGPAPLRTERPAPPDLLGVVRALRAADR